MNMPDTLVSIFIKHTDKLMSEYFSKLGKVRTLTDMGFDCDRVGYQLRDRLVPDWSMTSGVIIDRLLNIYMTEYNLYYGDRSPEVASYLDMIFPDDRDGQLKTILKKDFLEFSEKWRKENLTNVIISDITDIDHLVSSIQDDILHDLRINFSKPELGESNDILGSITFGRSYDAVTRKNQQANAWETVLYGAESVISIITSSGGPNVTIEYKDQIDITIRTRKDTSHSRDDTFDLSVGEKVSMKIFKALLILVNNYGYSIRRSIDNTEVSLI